MNKLIRGYLVTRWKGTTDTLDSTLSRFPSNWDPDGAATMGRIISARLRRRPAEGLAALARSGIPAVVDAYLFRPRAVLEGQLLADLGDSAASRARFAAAIPLLKDSVASPARRTDYRMRVALGEAYAGVGRRADALAIARALVEAAPRMRTEAIGSVALLGAAEVYTRAGAHAEAIALLDQLLDRYAGREASVPILRVDPTWDPLRTDPRFTQMLERPRVRRP